jgi:chaperone modulatory protein CbpM
MTRKLDERAVVLAVETVTVEDLRLWVAEGWVAPALGETGPAFDEVDVARVRMICQLRDACAVDEEAVPVILSLIDQLHGLRSELKALAQAVDAEPEEVKVRIRAAYRAVVEE